MVRLDWNLIRKKSEHHDGLLEDLEELSLHQLNIEKLETIGRFCPKLKILYLQNNLIPKIENIKRLKSLVYLNLALNNITSIPREIVSCEKLRKLDLTINFIDVDQLEESIGALSELIHLDELYLTGNPCTTWDGYRLYVIHRLTKLTKLDGTEVTRGERIQAKNAFEAASTKLRELAHAKRIEKGITDTSSSSSSSTSVTSASGGVTITEVEDDDDRAEQSERELSYAEKCAKTSAYTPESRLAMHREQEAFEKKKEEDKKRSQRGDQPEDLWKEAQDKLNQKVVTTDEDELPKQRNLGKWDFTIQEQTSNIVVDIAVQRFLDTSLIDIDVHPHWFQVLIKGKLLLLHFPEEIRPSDCKVQRLQVNGHLILTCPKVQKVQTNSFATSTLNKSLPRTEGDEKDDGQDDDDHEQQTQTTVTSHSNVLDFSKKSSSSSSSSSSSTSAFTRHMGNSLNQVTSDYRHIARSRDASSGAQMREVAVKRSATLEEARQAALEEAAAKRRAERSTEEEREELERLGLDDTGVPDLE